MLTISSKDFLSLLKQYAAKWWYAYGVLEKYPLSLLAKSRGESHKKSHDHKESKKGQK